MRPLKVNRFKQDPKQCSIAASTSVANYYNKNVSYELVRDVVQKEVLRDISEGLYSGHIGSLLNHLGFKKVKIVTCDLDLVDFTWNKFSHRKKVAAMNAMLRTHLDEDIRYNLSALRNFVANKNFKNTVVVDHHFGEQIRTALDAKSPILVSYNWTMLWGFPKTDEYNVADYIRGGQDYHSVCLRGYNDKGVFVVDSHWEFYKRKLKKYRNGFYTIPWEELLTVIGTGDLVIPTEYDEKLLRYELV